MPIWIDPQQPEILGTLSVGVSLDSGAANRFRSLTNSDIAFGMNGTIRASTLPQRALARPRAAARQLRSCGRACPSATRTTSPRRGRSRRVCRRRAKRVRSAGSTATGASVIILRSRTERLGFLNPLHGRLGIIAVVAVLAATLLSYAIARTVTRPLGAITATMREMAATGDLTRRIAAPPGGAAWEDEDARLLATTFNTMTDSIARFQREAAQRERLSSLGRLSTVVAHEIRNPLMIIKTALRTLRGPSVKPEELRAAVADIDEETARLNRLVSEVLDFAKPIKFDRAPTDLNALCEDAARAAGSDAPGDPDPAGTRPLAAHRRDRRRAAAAGARQHPDQRPGRGGRPTRRPWTPGTRSGCAPRCWGQAGSAIEVRDQGTGIASDDLGRVFDPYFTTRRTGTGLGLAISKNIVEGLGGTIAVSSRQGQGTEVRIILNAEAEC